MFRSECYVHYSFCGFIPTVTKESPHNSSTPLAFRALEASTSLSPVASSSSTKMCTRTPHQHCWTGLHREQILLGERDSPSILAEHHGLA